MKKKISILFLTLIMSLSAFSLSYADVNYTGVPVLMYHHLIESGTTSDSVLTKDTFEAQMKYLYDNGFTTITLSRLSDFMDGKIKLPAKSVVITFDDGYKSNYDIAYPILKKYGFHASQFVITSSIQPEGQPYPSDKLPHMTISEMKASSDVFEFHSHTNDMHRLNESNKSLFVSSTESELLSDLINANTTLKNAGFTSFAVAYPYGMYTQESKQIVQNLQTKMAFTIEPGRVMPKTDKFTIPRYNISDKVTLEEFKMIVDEDPNDIMNPATLKQPNVPVENPNTNENSENLNPELSPEMVDPSLNVN